MRLEPGRWMWATIEPDYFSEKPTLFLYAKKPDYKKGVPFLALEETDAKKVFGKRLWEKTAKALWRAKQAGKKLVQVRFSGEVRLQ